MSDEKHGVLGEPSWLVKDFHVLYRTARAVVDGKPEALAYLRAQIERLEPAFAHCEAERSRWAGELKR